MVKRLQKLPASQQQMFGQKMYDEAYAVMKTHPLDKSYGVCSVIFECAYPGHVDYYVKNVFQSRIKDESDPMRYGTVTEMDNNSWIATAVVESNGVENAAVAADACVMSAVLKMKTASGDFHRMISVIDKTPDGLPPSVEAIAALEMQAKTSIAALPSC